MEKRKQCIFKVSRKYFGYIIFFIVSIVIAACSKSTKVPEPEIVKENESSILPFEKYEVLSFKVLAGSKDGAVDVTDQFESPHKVFKGTLGVNSRLLFPILDHLVVKKDSIFEMPDQTEANRFKYKITTQDSLFRWNIYASFWQFYGYQRSSDRVEYVRSFYKFNRSRLSQIFLSGMEEGTLSEKDFIDETNPYRFSSLRDMTSKSDTIAVCNVRYIYKK